MEHWEFLLQQEGDRSWISLKHPGIAISEGRYRVVAHSNRPNTEVEIRITHYSTEEVPPKRRFQKRSRRTNRHGLMVVFPFTSLKAGQWELRCGGDLLADFMGNSWQASTSFQVLPLVAENEDISPPALEAESDPTDATPEETIAELTALLGQFEPDSPAALFATAPDSEADLAPLETATPSVQPPPVFSLFVENADWEETSRTEPLQEEEVLTESEPSQDPLEPAPAASYLPPLATSIPEPVQTADFSAEELRHLSVDELLERSLQMVDAILEEVVDPVWQEFDLLGGKEVKAPPPQPPTLFTILDPGQAEQSEQPESAEAGETTLSLEQTALMAKRGEALTLAGWVNHPGRERQNRRVQIQLRDPQSSQILVNLSQSIPNGMASFAFRCSLELPALVETRLLLGDVALLNGQGVALATESFTITAEISDILGVIGAIAAQQAQLATSLAEFEEPTGVDEALLNLVKQPKPEEPLDFQPTVSQPLPERITAPSPATVSIPPKLPPVPISAKAETPQPPAETTPPKPVKLPPRIRTEAVSPPKSLELPPISAAPPPPELPEDELKPEETSEALPDSDPGDLLDRLLLNLTENRPPAVTPAPEEAIALITPESTVDQPEETLSDESEEEEVDFKPSSPVDNAFANLQIQERFLSRLNVLAVDEEASSWLADEVPLPPEAVMDQEISAEVTPEEGETEPELEAEIAVPEAGNEPEDDSENDQAEVERAIAAFLEDPLLRAELNRPLPSEEELGGDTLSLPLAEIPPQAPLINSALTPEPVVDWQSQEIVVDDEEEAVIPPVTVNSPPTPVQAPLISQVDPALIPPEGFGEDPLPAPEVLLPSEDLTAGEAVLIRVKLPSTVPQVYVKLWVQDRQTRSLLDGPRWLVDFSPNGFGQLETATQFTVPLGSLEIRLEAITVETITQRESHKVTCDRVVVPPDLPDWSIEGLEQQW